MAVIHELDLKPGCTLCSLSPGVGTEVEAQRSHVMPHLVGLWALAGAVTVYGEQSVLDRWTFMLR